jgi:hypothetical protein
MEETLAIRQGISFLSSFVLDQLSSERRVLNAAASIIDKAPFYHIQVNYRDFTGHH